VTYVAKKTFYDSINIVALELPPSPSPLPAGERIKEREKIATNLNAFVLLRADKKL
jgi:hypothetical protein